MHDNFRHQGKVQGKSIKRLPSMRVKPSPTTIMNFVKCIAAGESEDKEFNIVRAPLTQRSQLRFNLFSKPPQIKVVILLTCFYLQLGYVDLVKQRSTDISRPLNFPVGQIPDFITLGMSRYHGDL